MEQTHYGYKKYTSKSFDDAVAAITSSLADEGFGVLTTIDVKETMKKKIGAEYDPYVILGACNPTFADKALTIDREIGLLLPCNVIVYQEGDRVAVSAILPTVAMSVAGGDAGERLAEVAGAVEEKLKRAVDAATA